VLESLFKSVRFRASASNAAPDHPVEAAVDGDPATFWHTEWQSGRQRLPAALTIDLGAEAGLRGFRYTPRQDMNRGRIDRYRVEVSRDGRAWKPAGSETRFPDSTAPQEILFPKSIVARHIRLTALSDHGAANAAAIVEFEPLPDLSTDSRRLGIIPGFNDGE
jgi:beta-galactosidase